MKRMSQFEIWMRSGRFVAQPKKVETKFNPWHDPDDGRFTFAGQGNYFGGGRPGASANSGQRVASASATTPSTGAHAARVPTAPALPTPTRAPAPAQVPNPKPRPVRPLVVRPKRSSPSGGSRSNAPSLTAQTPTFGNAATDVLNASSPAIGETGDQPRPTPAREDSASLPEDALARDVQDKVERAAKVYSSNGVLIGWQNINLTEEEFKYGAAHGMFKNLTIDDRDKAGFSTVQQLEQAGKRNARVVSSHKGKAIEATAEQRQFVARIAPYLSKAPVPDKRDVEKYLGVTQIDDGAFLVKDIVLTPAFGARLSPKLISGSTFIVHTHIEGPAKSRGKTVWLTAQTPGEGDNSVLKALGISNFIVEDRTRRPTILEIVQQPKSKGEPTYFYRKIDSKGNASKPIAWPYKA